MLSLFGYSMSKRYKLKKKTETESNVQVEGTYFNIFLIIITRMYFVFDISRGLLKCNVVFVYV